MAPTAIVLDMDGVLLLDWEPLPGAREAVERLAAAGHALGVLTNTTSRPRAEIAAALAERGMAIPAERVVTATSATAQYLHERHAGARVLVLAEPEVAPQLEGVSVVEGAGADVVVIGGADPEAFAWERLETAFRALHAGAVLVAMHENRWWSTAAGPRLDGGAAVRGLAYAAGVRPRVVGKPSARIFRSACALLGARPAEAVMVGDDLRSDVLPARRAGLRGVLVRTGKGERSAADPRAGEADAILDSVADLPGWLAGG